MILPLQRLRNGTARLSYGRLAELDSTYKHGSWADDAHRADGAQIVSRRREGMGSDGHGQMSFAGRQ